MITYGFVFARGGSKGLPRKNVKILGGKPMICYAIEVAKSVPEIDKVFVSTDDLEIAKIAEKAGAIVIKRPSELAGDKSPEWFAWQHAIEWVEEKHGMFEQFVSLPVTSPLRSVEDVQNAINKKRSSDSDVCISVTPSNRSPFFNMVKIDNNDVVSLVCQSENQIVRRQDAPEVFDISTVVYVLSKSFIMENNGIFDGKVTSIEVPKHRAVDIDDIYDFKLAESILLDQE